MDTFAKYREMRDQGGGSRQIYLAAKADGLDAIALIRLLRTLFNLSLADAKRVSSQPDVFNEKQEVRAGATVYWEGADTVEGAYLMQARVARVEGDRAFLEGHKKFRVTRDGVEEVPVAGDGPVSIPLAYFDKTLAERLGEALRFWEGVPGLNGHLDKPLAAAKANEPARQT